jgi:arsenical pump membrane protein
MTAIRILLLVVAVAGAVARPFRVPSFVAPVLCAAVALLAGTTTWHAAGRAVGPLEGAIGFLLAAIPLAVLLERYGYFEQVASLFELFENGRFLLLGLWLLGTLTVAVLNLDAAVVLLTPLYLKIARQQGRSAQFLGFQPVILALLASSFLPVSNLTNLIAVGRFGISPLAFLEHLGLPSLAACTVGYLCYRSAAQVTDPALAAAAAGRRRGSATDGTLPGQPKEEIPERDRRVLLVGSGVVVALLAGFVAGPLVGLQPWVVALAADGVLMTITRRLPWRSVPWATALLALGLAVLADSAAHGFHLGGVLTGTGPLAELRQAGVSAGLGNVVDNLPALLVSLPFLHAAGGAGGAGAAAHAAHANCAVWPVLLGVNIGPSLLITGTLASLLWFEAMNRLDARVTPMLYLKVGLRVGVPAGLVALAVLIAMSPALGCG